MRYFFWRWNLKKLLFATSNSSKVKRFYDKLKENGIELISLSDIDLKLVVEENGKDAVENALIKARAYYNMTGITTMAMDDSLYLENVSKNIEPGLFVRRVNGKTLSDAEMIEHYSKLARDYGTDGKICARWVYGLAIIKDGKENTYTWSKDEFYIVDKPSKIINKGYPLNSVSVDKSTGKYFTEIPKEEASPIKKCDSGALNFILDNV